VDTGGGLPHLGIPLAALGAVLAIEPLLVWTLLDGRWVAGLALLGIGLPLLARRSVLLEGEGLRAAWSWRGLTLSRREVETASGDSVRVAADAAARGYEIRLGTAAAERMLGSFHDHEAARAAAFPEDFRGGWADYARTHRLPPPS
jgi:hypothetical protein